MQHIHRVHVQRDAFGAFDANALGSLRKLLLQQRIFSTSREAFPAKNLSASLNVYTMNVLFAYGYTNVYELGPLIDIHQTLIPFERARAVAAR